MVLQAVMGLLKWGEVEFAGQNLPVDRNLMGKQGWVPHGACTLLVVIDDEGLDIIEAVRQ